MSECEKGLPEPETLRLMLGVAEVPLNVEETTIFLQVLNLKRAIAIDPDGNIEVVG